MPARIYKEARYRDSLLHSKDSAYLIARGYIRIIKDTMGIDEVDDEESLDKLKQRSKEDNKTNGEEKKKPAEAPRLQDAILPDEQKKPKKDTIE